MTPAIGGSSVRLTRTLKATPDEVYQAFLDPARLSRWFGPGDFDVLDVDIDPRPGGRHHTVVAGPNGIRGTFACEIRELIPAERIVLSWSWVLDSPTPQADPQHGSVLTITLREAAAGVTELTLLHSHLGGLPDEDPPGIHDAWGQALDKLDRSWAAAG